MPSFKLEYLLFCHNEERVARLWVQSNMCGIAGIVDLENNPIQARHLLAMNQAIAHRGPDDEGYVLIDGATGQYRNFAGPLSPADIKARHAILSAGDCVAGANIGLAHGRFSIIDLSSNGHQPFFDGGASCCIVFNGEIYNYREIRDELVAQGMNFHSESDTEVLVAAYKRWGIDAFARLNGFWALALYDFAKRKLFLSRDRIGKKPLYYTKVGSRVFFASEIKSLMAVPEIHQRRRINEQAVYTWIAEGRKDLNSSTCFDGIYSLPAASIVELDESFPQKCTIFWRVPDTRLAESDISTEEAARGLRDLLQDSVRIRLRADVPLSVELSGGLDSSALVALAAQVHGGTITTYTVRFPDDRCNEEPFARSVALYHKTDYHVLESPSSNFWSQILPFTYLEEEPYHSPNLQTNQAVWAKMRGKGSKVSLNGAGGDENFAGYSAYYLPVQTDNLLNRRFGTYLRNAVTYSQGRTNIRGLIEPLGTLAMAGARKLMQGGRASNSQGRQVPFLKGLKPVQPLAASLRLPEVLYQDMTNTLMPYWLRSGDRGYMGIPFEVRAPFLDYRVIEYAFRLPVTYLFRNGWHKWILRKALEDILPADVVWRKQKMGFPFPFDRFYSENKKLISTLLSEAQNPYLDFSRQKEFRHDWKVLSFILWYELFFNENVTLFHKLQTMSQSLNEDYGFAPEFLSSEGWLR